MKTVQSSIQRGSEYVCTKMGDVVTAIEQVTVWRAEDIHALIKMA
jgi:hypothetical protein